LLAQADLEGGGNAEDGRSKSPLPDLQKVENGDSLRAARRIEELEQVQKHLLDQAKAKTNFHVAEQDKRKLDQKPVNTPGAEDLETSKAIARMAAEINQTIEDQNRRPRKSFITPTAARWLCHLLQAIAKAD
jgi:protein TonB